MDWLADYLRPGPAKAKDVQREAREAGISEKALRTARERLGVKPTKRGFAQGWRWELPREDAQDARGIDQVAHPPEEGIFGDEGHLRAEDGAAHGEPSDAPNTNRAETEAPVVPSAEDDVEII